MKFLLLSPGINQIVENTVQGHDNIVIPQNQDLVLKFIINNTETQGSFVISDEIIKNFCAVLNKSWKFIFPNDNPPRNPHHSGWLSRGFYDSRVLLLEPEDRSVEVILPNGEAVSVPQLKSIIWRLANAFEWCTLPNRKKLSGQSSFTLETWNAISVYCSSDTLARTTLSESPAPDPEHAVLDHQVQIDVAE